MADGLDEARRLRLLARLLSGVHVDAIGPLGSSGPAFASAAGGSITPGSAPASVALGYIWTGAAWVPARTNPGDGAGDTIALAVQGLLRSSAGTQNRWREAAANGTQIATGVAAVAGYQLNAALTNWQPLLEPGDARANSNLAGAGMEGWNDATWDRWRNNVAGTALASAANAASTRTSAVITNHNARGVMLFLNVSALGAGESLTTKLLAVDPITGAGQRVTAFAGFGSVNLAVYIIYPGAVETSDATNAFVQGVPIPRSLQVAVDTSPGVNASTYSVGYSLIQ